MEWMEKKDLLDGAGRLLLELYKVRGEGEGMKKARTLLLLLPPPPPSGRTDSFLLRQLLERYERREGRERRGGEGKGREY